MFNESNKNNSSQKKIANYQEPSNFGIEIGEQDSSSFQGVFAERVTERVFFGFKAGSVDQSSNTGNQTNEEQRYVDHLAYNSKIIEIEDKIINIIESHTNMNFQKNRSLVWVVLIFSVMITISLVATITALVFMSISFFEWINCINSICESDNCRKCN